MGVFGFAAHGRSYAARLSNHLDQGAEGPVEGKVLPEPPGIGLNTRERHELPHNTPSFSPLAPGIICLSGLSHVFEGHPHIVREHLRACKARTSWARFFNLGPLWLDG